LKAFNTVVLDVDSTLCGIEGIDWLAKRRPPAVAEEVAKLTHRPMDGEIELDAVYGARLSLVAPTRSEVEKLGDEYVLQVAPGAVAAIATMQRRGIEVHLVSGGLLPAVRTVGAAAGVPEQNVHAVEIHFDERGNYERFDSASSLCRHNGKRQLVSSLALTGPTLMVGDGITDADVKPVVDAFAAFTGFVARDAAVERADHVVSSFAEILTLLDI